MKRPLFLILLALATTAQAGIDLVTLPERDSVQLTIYNSADLTLVRERRMLTLREGLNRLQFSWANTLIDPTSLSMLPLDHADRIDVHALVFPPRLRDLGIWSIDSRHAGGVPMEITCFTSGISWRAFYMGTLTPDESTMHLRGYVVVTNASGEEYANAQTRLIVGKVHLLDQIANLARRYPPYGSPVPPPPQAPRPSAKPKVMAGFYDAAAPAPVVMNMEEKKIVKEGLSEYFLYTIEGTETIPDGWSKRLPSFEADAIPVVNLYKFEAERWGSRPVRFLSFLNDRDHHLGETPIPGGALMVYRDTGKDAHLSYEGRSSFQYIPVDEEVELNLGPVDTILVEPTLMEYRTVNYRFNQQENIVGWDEIRTVEVEIKNTRPLPIRLEFTRNVTESTVWEVTHQGEFGDYSKVDMDTFRHTLDLSPRTTSRFSYTLTTRHGTRATE